MADDQEPQGMVETSLAALASTEEVTKKKVRRSLRESMRLKQPEFRFGELLALLILTFIFNGSMTTPTRWHGLVLVLLESLTIMVALHASRAKRLTINLAAVACVLALISAVAELILNWHVLRASTALLTVLLVVISPIAVVRGIIRRRDVDIRTVLAALCLYVMFGMLFATIYSATDSMTTQTFFAQTQHPSPSDYSYFSFITLTTVGYGDLTAAHPLGRTLAAFEAMFGQLYLVSVVAVLVSNMGPIFKSRKSSGDGMDDGRDNGENGANDEDDTANATS